MRKTLCAAALAAALGGTGAAQADDGVIRIGFITDMSGLSADADGPGGVEAIKMAVADLGGVVAGKKVEVLVADHQNRADIASSRAREWLDQKGVTMLIAGANSAAALAMAKVAEEKKTPFFVVSAGASELTNSQCTPYTVHYVYDTVSLARGTARAMLKEGNKDWFFLTVDHAFGQALERDASTVVQAEGGTVKGRVRHPLNTADFSSFILQAQASGASVLGLANSASDTSNAVKAAAEFGLTPKMKIAGLLVLITDIHALGLPAAQGMYLTTAWYWEDEEEAVDAAGRRLLGHHHLPEGRGRHRQHRWRHGDEVAEGQPGERLLRERRQDPRRRPDGARHVPDAGEDAGGIERPVGLLQAGGARAGRPDLYLAGRIDLPPDEAMIPPGSP